jgi:hypothetical protein
VGVGTKLGVSLAGIVNLLNPDCIVIGGGVAKAGRLLFDTVNKTIGERAMPVHAKAVKVVAAKLGYDAGMIGADSWLKKDRKSKSYLRENMKIIIDTANIKDIQPRRKWRCWTAKRRIRH